MQGIGFAFIAAVARLSGRVKPEPDEMATPSRDVRTDRFESKS